MADRFDRRGFTVVPGQQPPARPVPPELAIELREVREEALARYSEVDLLVAALREHIGDLRLERDRLLEENERLAAELKALRASEAAAGAHWLISRQKSQR
jgi:hypothetical protein